MMRRFILACMLAASCGSVYAQEDLLGELNKEEPKDQKSTPVYATFKSTRIVNGHSVECMSARHLDFRIQHRFGELNSGAYEFYGLDQATMRLGFEYGITNDLMIGLGRSTVSKTYDGFVKWRFLKQSKGGKHNIPVTLAYFGNAGLVSAKFSDPSRNNYFSSRMSYTHQLLIARKFKDILSLQLTPTVVHKNLVAKKSDPNDIFAIGIGGSVRISRSIRFNVDYFPRLNGDDKLYANCLALGFDIETGGHVFQLHFTNSLGLIENQFITDTQGKWDKGDVRFGFNISRTFSFDRKQKGDKKW